MHIIEPRPDEFAVDYEYLSGAKKKLKDDVRAGGTPFEGRRMKGEEFLQNTETSRSKGRFLGIMQKPLRWDLRDGLSSPMFRVGETYTLNYW